MIKPLTKKDIKEIVTDVIEPFAHAVQEDFKKVDKRFDGVETRLDKLEIGMGDVRARLSGVEEDVSWMKENSGAIFTKLDRFITLYEKQEQEMLIMGEHIRRLEERIIKLEKQPRANPT